MKFFSLLLVAILVSCSSFIVHVFTAEWLSVWVSAQMSGFSIEPSWSVRYVAALTSIEYGFASLALYYLAREKLKRFNLFTVIILYAILLAAIHGAFIRQPFMDFYVGNPFHVVLVQNLFKWLIWLVMSVITVLGVEYAVYKGKS